MLLKAVNLLKTHSSIRKDSGGGVLTSVIGEAEYINYGEKPALKTRQ